MKKCPRCRIHVGGDADYCPLCQNALSGTGEAAYFPPTAPQLHRLGMLQKILLFLVLSGVVICAAFDFLLQTEPHLHWSILVLVWSLAGLFFLRILLGRRYNGPLLVFQILVVTGGLGVFTDWFLGFTGVSVDVFIPILCSAALLLNFLFAFLNSRFTANALVYLLLNIVVGVVPYLLLILRGGDARAAAHSAAWVICLLVSVLTFLGLVIFKGRILFTEIEKRLHL